MLPSEGYIESMIAGGGTYTRLDSLNAIKVNINPDLVIHFDLDNQRVTPIYNNDTIEVISTDWNRIKEYFE